MSASVASPLIHRHQADGLLSGTNSIPSSPMAFARETATKTQDAAASSKKKAAKKVSEQIDAVKPIVANVIDSVNGLVEPVKQRVEPKLTLAAETARSAVHASSEKLAEASDKAKTWTEQMLATGAYLAAYPIGAAVALAKANLLAVKTTAALSGQVTSYGVRLYVQAVDSVVTKTASLTTGAASSVTSTVANKTYEVSSNAVHAFDSYARRTTSASRMVLTPRLSDTLETTYGALATTVAHPVTTAVNVLPGPLGGGVTLVSDTATNAAKSTYDLVASVPGGIAGVYRNAVGGTLTRIAAAEKACANSAIKNFDELRGMATSSPESAERTPGSPTVILTTRNESYAHVIQERVHST
ncbi:hypothetical protein DFS34DRAFT_591718 [Phlyctochytrium arcticum]|nr:hypothetical protein DFS34DRAFT_591718 [Phlyctochytrium arcticum]